MHAIVHMTFRSWRSRRRRGARCVAAVGIAVVVSWSSPPGEARPAASAAVRDASASDMSGVWDGFIWGRELAQSRHLTDYPARLRVGPDGAWSLASSLGSARGVISDLEPGLVELDGRAGSAEEPTVWLRLHRVRDGVLIGLVHSHHAGRTALTSIHLWRTDPTRPPGPAVRRTDRR